MVPKDAKALYAAVEDSRKEISQFLPFGDPDYSWDAARTWVHARPEEWKSGIEYTFSIELMGVSGFIGVTGVRPNGKERDAFASLGYWMHTGFSERGHCTRAARLAAAFAFSKLRCRRLEILAMTHNLASRRVIEKLGASFEGVLRSRLGLRGKYYDAACYSILAGELLNPPAGPG